MLHIFFSLLFICIFLQSGAQTNIPELSGWVMKQNPGFVSFTPAGSGNKQYVYNIYHAAGIQVDNWFTQAVAKNRNEQGFTEIEKGASYPVMMTNIYLTRVKDKTGKEWWLCYMGYATKANQMRLAYTVSDGDKDWFEQQTTTAMKHFMQLGLKEDAVAVNTKIPDQRQDESKDKTVPSANQPPSVKKNNPPAVIKPAVSGSIQNSDIHSVIIRLEYTAGMGGAVYPEYNPYILLKDGSIYKHPVESPYHINIALSKQNEPRKWGTWKMEGTTIKTYWPAEQNVKYRQGEWKAGNWKKVPPAKKGETLSGSFKTITGGGNTALGGDVITVASANISFNSSGQFTLAKSAGVMGGSGAWDTHTAKSNDAGTYILNEYMIELKFNNGKTERRFFYFYPDSRTHFGIGGSAYLPQKKQQQGNKAVKTGLFK